MLQLLRVLADGGEDNVVAVGETEVAQQEVFGDEAGFGVDHVGVLAAVEFGQEGLGLVGVDLDQVPDLGLEVLDDGGGFAAAGQAHDDEELAALLCGPAVVKLLCDVAAQGLALGGFDVVGAAAHAAAVLGDGPLGFALPGEGAIPVRVGVGLAAFARGLSLADDLAEGGVLPGGVDPGGVGVHLVAEGGEGVDLRVVHGEDVLGGGRLHALHADALGPACEFDGAGVERGAEGVGLGLAVAGLDEVLDEGCGVVGGDDGEGGPELCVECGEDVGDLALGDIGEAGDDGAALLEGDVDGRVGEGVGAEFLPGLQAMLGDGLCTPDEGVDVRQDTSGHVLRGAGGFGEAAVAVGVEEARVLVTALLGVVDDALDGFQRKLIDSQTLLWDTDGVKGGLCSGRREAS